MDEEQPVFEQLPLTDFKKRRSTTLKGPSIITP